MEGMTVETLQVGDYAIPDMSNSLMFTAFKAYKIVELYEDHAFWVRDNYGEKTYCLQKDCFWLDGRTWGFKKSLRNRIKNQINKILDYAFKKGKSS